MVAHTWPWVFWRPFLEVKGSGLEVKGSGKGQIVDAAMVDAAASMMAYFFGFSASGYWNEERGSNYLDSGSPFYDTYETKDGKWIAIGSVEAKFWEQTGACSASIWRTCNLSMIARIGRKRRRWWPRPFGKRRETNGQRFSMAKKPAWLRCFPYRRCRDILTSPPARRSSTQGHQSTRAGAAVQPNQGRARQTAAGARRTQRRDPGRLGF